MGGCTTGWCFDLKKKSEYKSAVCLHFRFQDFSVIQILREINFREARSSKIAVLPFLGL